MYGILNTLYVIGIINIHSINNPNIKLFINKLFLDTNVNIKYIITTFIERILNLTLFFLFIKGLLTVSEGAYMLIIARASKYNIYSKYFGKTMYLHKIENIINNRLENIRHIELLLACIPNAKNLIKLKETSKQISSFNIPNISAIMHITTVLVKVK